MMITSVSLIFWGFQKRNQQINEESSWESMPTLCCSSAICEQSFVSSRRSDRCCAFSAAELAADLPRSFDWIRPALTRRNPLDCVTPLVLQSTLPPALFPPPVRARWLSQRVWISSTRSRSSFCFRRPSASRNFTFINSLCSTSICSSGSLLTDSNFCYFKNNFVKYLWRHWDKKFSIRGICKSESNGTSSRRRIRSLASRRAEWHSDSRMRRWTRSVSSWWMVSTRRRSSEPRLTEAGEKEVEAHDSAPDVVGVGVSEAGVPPLRSEQRGEAVVVYPRWQQQGASMWVIQ